MDLLRCEAVSVCGLSMDSWDMLHYYLCTNPPVRKIWFDSVYVSEVSPFNHFFEHVLKDDTNLELIRYGKAEFETGWYLLELSLVAASDLYALSKESGGGLSITPVDSVDDPKLNTVDLSGHSLGTYFGCDDFLVMLLEDLGEDNLLQELILSRCYLTCNMVYRLKSVLSKNNTLKILDLSRNSIDRFAVSVLACAILTNRGLQVLDLWTPENDEIDYAAVSDLVEATRQNSQLRTIVLSPKNLSREEITDLDSQLAVMNSKKRIFSAFLLWKLKDRNLVSLIGEFQHWSDGTVIDWRLVHN